jgi:hypothetical protein
LTNFFNSGTNGSYKDDMEQQPSGYKMAKETKSQDAITAGLQENQSAHRSELGGILGILVFLNLLQQHYALKIHQFIITLTATDLASKA